MYFLSAEFGLSVATVDEQVSPVWPPTGIGLAAVLVFGRRIWPAVAAGAFAINAVSGPVPAAMGIAVGNTLEAVVGAGLLTRFTDFHNALDRPRDVIALALFGGTIGTTVAATIGVASLCAAGATQWSAYGSLWWTWWLGDAMGALVVAPALLIWSSWIRSGASFPRGAESLFFLQSTTVASIWLLHTSSPRAAQLKYWLLPLFVWSALRLGQLATSVGLLVVSFVATLGVQAHSETFVAETMNERLLLMQTFVGVLSLGSLALGAVEAERARSVRERRQSEERLSAIFNQTNSGIAQVDLTGRFVLVSPRYCELVGRSPEELLTLRFHDILHGDERAAHRQLFEKCVQEGDAFDIEERYLRPDGSSIWVHNSVSLIRDAEGRAQFVVAVSQDITEKKRMERERAMLLQSEQAARLEAERLARVKDDFVATLSHELRTPLNGVLGWTQLLKRPSADRATLAEGLDTIERCARALAQLIDDLLDLTRIVSGKMRLQVEAVDLVSTIAAAIDMIAPTAQYKQVRLETRLEAIDGPMKGDGARLQQVVWNLLSNAVKFTPPGGIVYVSLQQRDGHARIIIRDTGQGIRPEFLPHVFDRFRQADSSTTRRFGGLGLGLAIVRHIVQLHDGTVWAESPGEGRGATFVVDIPIQIAAPRPESAHPPATATLPAAHAKLFGMRVLVVDDDPDSCGILRQMLTDCGAEVIMAASADEALSKIAFRPHLLVSDIGMPDRDGYELIREIRRHADRETSTLPAVAVTAFARPEDRERALEAGYSRHVAKPVEAGALLAAISELVATPS